MSPHNNIMTEILPPELWCRVLRHVPSTSLCHVTLVSKHFRQLCQDPRLWSDVRLRREVIQREGLGPLLDNPR